MNIYALSSGRGPSGIAIIRLSGKNTFQISKLICKNNNLKSKEANLTKFYDPLNNNIIDEGLLLLFNKPNSYTGDDVAEFHIHGSNAVINKFLDVLSKTENCRLAEPGEFTKTAFLNNKLDLVECEGIEDLINSETELQRKQAVQHLQGKTSDYYNNLREKLIKSLAYVEAKIDFAEDDLPESAIKEAHKSIKEVYRDIKIILEDDKIGEKIREGFKISIIGEVNAGKSSLMNLISKREVAIVSAEKGTTRDIIDTYINLDGYPVIFSDTAGIRESNNEVEKKGIALAISKSKESDLNIIMVDSSSKKIASNIKKLITKDSIIVFNKSDINNIQIGDVDHEDTLLISVKENKNIDKLVIKIKEKLKNKFIKSNNVLVTRARHRNKLNACISEIDKFLQKTDKTNIELAAEDLRMASRHLGSIVGKVDVEEILGSIFKDFCIGK